MSALSWTRAALRLLLLWTSALTSDALALSSPQPPAVSGAAIADEPARLVSRDHGFVLRSADGRNSLRFLGLLQVQYAQTWSNGAAGSGALQIPRARAGVTGTVFSDRLRYLLVADFGRATPQLVYASLDWTALPGRLAIRAGQFKRPFSASFLTPSSQLSLIDRPLTVGAFGDNSDIGLMLHNGDSQPFEYAVGLFGGSSQGQVSPTVSARVVGKIGGMQGYTESDLQGGPPRMGVGGAVTLDLGADAERPVRGLVDLRLAAWGLSFTTAVQVGARRGGPDEPALRPDAVGHHAQVGYVFARRVEPVVRYAFVSPFDQTEAQHDLQGGLNLFLQGHSLKLQSNVGVRFEVRDHVPVRDVSFKSQLNLVL